MKSTLLFKRNFSVTLFCLALFCMHLQVKAQVIITNTTPVTQNFNSMGTSGTASLPSGFKIGTDYASGTTATTQAYGTTGTGAVGSSSSGAAVNWADGITGSSTDRAVGFLNSGSFTSPRSIIMEIQNNGTSNITSLLVAFNYEKYRTGSRAFDWTFFHGGTTTAATANTAGDQSYAADSGNNAVNPATSVSKSFTLSGLNIAPAAKYYLRWTFTGVGGSTNGQGMGIDNLSLTATFQAAATPTITGAATTVVFTTTYGTASSVQTFAISGSNLTASITATAPTGFEVSADGVSYNTTATFTQSGGNASGSLRIRLKANATVGAYNSKTIVLSSTGATSVNITTPASGNTVNAKNLTITGLTGADKVYDQNVSASFTGTAAYSGLVNSESFSVGGTPTATFANALAANGKTITVSGYTAPSANYTITQPTVSGNITPKGVSISGVSVNNKSYDNTNTAVLNFGSASVTGVISPDVVTVNAASATATFDSIDAGTGIGITIAGFAIGGADAGNYTLSGQPSGITANINKADQIITFSPLDPKLDTDADFDLIATASSGLAVTYSSSDMDVADVSGNTVHIAGSGTTTITATQIGNNNFNAAIAVNQVLNVSSTAKQDQVITFNVLAPVTYGDDAFELSATTTSGLMITYNSSDTNVATVSGNTVTIIAPGTTIITASQIGDEDFNPATPVQQPLTVNTKALTVTGATAVSKEYDGSTDAIITGALLVGIVGTDDVTVSGNGNFIDANAELNKNVTAMLILSGTDNVRYSLTQPIGLTADITAKETTISGLSVNNKVYDANTTATLSGIAILEGVLPADAGEVGLDISAVTADFDTPAPGNGKNVAVTGYTLTGTSAPNYVLSQPALIGNLFPKGLFLSGVNVEDKTYDGTTTAVSSGTPIVDGIVGAEDVIIDGTAIVAFADANAGDDKALQVTGLSLTGADAGNYTLDSSGITASIIPAALTYVADPASRQYNTANPTFTGAVIGFVNGEDIAAATGTLTFTSPASPSSIPGAYAINGSGLTAANYTFTQDAANATALTITKADQTITFGTLPVKTTADAPFALTATASSGLTVSYSSSNPTVATISGATVTIAGTGTTTITANQAGDGNYNAATAVDRVLTVNAVPVSIFSNPITGTNPNTVNPYTNGQSVNANITVSGIGRSGVTGANANDRYNASGWDSPAINTSRYFEFTLTPNSGFEIDFASLVYAGQASGSGPVSVVIRSSADNYTAGIGSPTIAGTTISLASAAYQNITTPITFRIYGFGASAAGGTFSINSFTFNGNVNASAVPSVSVTPAALTALDYFVGSGPSASKTLNVTGASLNPASGNLTATASANFEVSADNIAFANTAIVTYTGGGVNNVLIYVRTISGLDMGTYNGTVTISGGSAPNVVRNVQGVIREPFTIPYINDFRTQAAVDNALAQGFIINNTTFNATGYEQMALNGYIETPVIDFTQTSTIQVSYAAATFGGVSGQTLELQISVDNGTNYTTIGTIVPPSATFTTTKTDIDLALYPVTTGKLRIKMTAGGNTTRFRDLYILKTTTWDGDAWSNGVPDSNAIAAIDGDYTTQTDGALIAKSLTVLSGEVIVSSGTTMHLDDELNNTAGTVHLENNANLIQVNAAANTGEITIERNAMMRRQDYVYWSSPVSNQLLFDFTPETLPNRFYVLNETTNLFAAVDPTVTTFANGKGYMLRAPNNFPTVPQNFNGVFTGTPYNGTVVVPVTTTGQGYNLIGNPYPSPISAAAFASANPTIGTLYFWTHTQQGADSGANYATYNGTGAASALGGDVPNGTIQTGQGFMIKAPLNTTSVTFNNVMRIDNHDNQFFRTADRSDQGSRLWLNLTNASKQYNQILIGYVEGATDGLDIQFDGKMLENQNAVLYNIVDNNSYTIQGKALPFADSDLVPLGFKATEAGDYTITLDHFDGLFSAGQDIFLKDNTAGMTVNLKDAPYTFVASSGTFEQRFEVVYQNAPLSVTPVTADESIVIFSKDDNLEIHSGNANLADVALYDIRGRLLFRESSMNTSAAVIRNPGMSQQVIIIRVRLEDGRVISRKIVF